MILRLINYFIFTLLIIFPLKVANADVTINSNTTKTSSQITSDDDNYNITSGARLTLDIDSAITYTDVIKSASTSEDLYKEGSERILFTNHNTFTGHLRVVEGTLAIDSTGGFSTLDVRVNSSGTLELVDKNFNSSSRIILLAGTLTLSDGGSDNIAFNNSLIRLNSNATISASAGDTFNLYDGNSTTVIDQVSGENNNLTIGGSGTVRFSDQADLGTGILTVNSGATLQLNVADAISDSAPLVVNGTLDIDEDDTIDEITGSGTLDIESGNVLSVNGDGATFAGKISGAGNFRKVSNDNLTLSGSSHDFTGNFQIFAGDVDVTGSLPTGAVIEFRDNYGVNKSITFDAANHTIGGVTDETNSIDSHSVTFSTGGDNDLILNVASGATLDTYADFDGNYGTGQLIKSGAGAQTIQGIISSFGTSGNPGVVVQAGTLTLSTSSNNTFDGGVDIEGGTLSISKDRHLGSVPFSADADNIILDGGTLEITGSTNFTIDSNRGITVNSASTLDIDNASMDLTYAGILAGSGNLTKDGSGEFVLQGTSHTFSGDLIVNEGALRLPSGTADSYDFDITVKNAASLSINNKSINSNNTVTVESGGVVNLYAGTGAGRDFSGNFNIAGTGNTNGKVNVASTITTTGDTDTLAQILGTITLSGDANILYRGNVTDISGGKIQFGDDTDGTQTTAVDLGSNTFTLLGKGSSNAAALREYEFFDLVTGTGTLDVDQYTKADFTNAQGGLGDSVNLDIQGTIELDTDDTIASLTGTSTGIVDLQGITLTISPGSGVSTTYAGVITDTTGTGNITKSGVGTLALTNANTYSGTTSITAGTLEVGNASALSTGALTMTGGQLSSDGSTARNLGNALTLNGTMEIGDATNTGAITLGATTLSGTTVLTTSSNVNLGAVSGNNSFTKTGSGTLTVDSMTGSGGTTISGGTLVALSTGSSPNIHGTFTRTGTTTINNGGTLTIRGTMLGAAVPGDPTWNSSIVINSGGQLRTYFDGSSGSSILMSAANTITGTGEIYFEEISTVYYRNNSDQTLSVDVTADSGFTQGGLELLGTGTVTYDGTVTAIIRVKNGTLKPGSNFDATSGTISISPNNNTIGNTNPVFDIDGETVTVETINIEAQSGTGQPSIVDSNSTPGSLSFTTLTDEAADDTTSKTIISAILSGTGTIKPRGSSTYSTSITSASTGFTGGFSFDKANSNLEITGTGSVGSEIIDMYASGLDSILTIDAGALAHSSPIIKIGPGDTLNVKGDEAFTLVNFIQIPGTEDATITLDNNVTIDVNIPSSYTETVHTGGDAFTANNPFNQVSLTGGANSRVKLVGSGTIEFHHFSDQSGSGGPGYSGDIEVAGATLNFGDSNEIHDSSDVIVSSGTLNFAARSDTFNSLTISGGYHNRYFNWNYHSHKRNDGFRRNCFWKNFFCWKLCVIRWNSLCSFSRKWKCDGIR